MKRQVADISTSRVFGKVKRALYLPLGISLAVGAQTNGHRLAWDSQFALLDLAVKVLRKEPFSIADQTYILKGHPIVLLDGFDKVATCLWEYREQGTGVLFVANHYHDIPLGVGGNAVALIHSLRYIAQKTLPEEEVKDPYVAVGIGRRAVISGVVDRLSASCHVVPVGRNTGGSERIQALLKVGEWVLNYLESHNSTNLTRGSRGGGISVYLAARQSAAVVPVGIWCEDGKVLINLGEPFDRRRIISLGGSAEVIDGEAVSDYAMREGIKPLLPPGLWGVYGKGV